jgi:hypothetical protein
VERDAIVEEVLGLGGVAEVPQRNLAADPPQRVPREPDALVEIGRDVRGEQQLLARDPGLVLRLEVLEGEEDERREERDEDRGGRCDGPRRQPHPAAPPRALHRPPSDASCRLTIVRAASPARSISGRIAVRHRAAGSR